MKELVPQVVLQLLPPAVLPERGGRGPGQRALPLPPRLRDLGEGAEEPAKGRGKGGEQGEQGLCGSDATAILRSKAGRKRQTHSTFSTLFFLLSAEPGNFNRNE